MITSLFGVAGAGLLSRKMRRRVQGLPFFHTEAKLWVGLREFEFDLVRGTAESSGLTITLGVDGWLTAEELKQHADAGASQINNNKRSMWKIWAMSA